MESLRRKPFQGVWNIIRFNWHFYVLAALAIVILWLITYYSSSGFIEIFSIIVSIAILLSLFVSLTVSFYIYDYSGLYSLEFLDELHIAPGKKLVNIHAGFDETSYIFQEKFPTCSLIVMDFYDPAKHSEISIKRARKVYPPFPDTQIINTANVPLAPGSVDYIFLIFAAHEIRDSSERNMFFNQLANALNTGGKIVVMEHQRDIVNFLAYNVGFLHFLSAQTWHKTFLSASIYVEKTIKVTPFISTFILRKNAVAN